jgi:hypothetical protein
VITQPVIASAVAPSVPVLDAETYPAEYGSRICGALHPSGITISSVPEMNVSAAVYRNVHVPAEPAVTSFEGVITAVPEPAAASAVDGSLLHEFA